MLALVPSFPLSLLKTLSRKLAVSISAFCRVFLPFLGLAVELVHVEQEQGRAAAALPGGTAAGTVFLQGWSSGNHPALPGASLEMVQVEARNEVHNRRAQALE